MQYNTKNIYEITISKALEKIVKEHGKEVLKSPQKIQAMITDYVNGYENDKKLFKRACQYGILDFAYEILTLKDNRQINILEKKAKQRLIEDAFMDDKKAADIVDIILNAMKNINTENFNNFNNNPIFEDMEDFSQKGDVYFYGKEGIEQDYYEAMQWYKKAAEQGMPEGQVKYGKCLKYSLARMEESIGEQLKEMKKIKSLFKEAAEQGNPEAMCEYAHFLKTKSEVAQWFKKAAEHGNLEGQVFYAYHLKEGVKIIRKKNRKEAAQLFYKAAKQGDIIGQIEYGRCLEYGIGVKKDQKEAIEWYKKAQNQKQELQNKELLMTKTNDYILQAKFLLAFFLKNRLGEDTDAMYEETNR